MNLKANDLYESLVVVDKNDSSIIFMIDDFDGYSNKCGDDNLPPTIVIGRYSNFHLKKKEKINMYDFLKRFKDIKCGEFSYYIWDGITENGHILKENIFCDIDNKLYTREDIKGMSIEKTRNVIACMDNLTQSYLISIYKNSNDWIKYVDKIASTIKKQDNYEYSEEFIKIDDRDIPF